jgi:hypothetical protein
MKIIRSLNQRKIHVSYDFRYGSTNDGLKFTRNLLQSKFVGEIRNPETFISITIKRDLENGIVEFSQSDYIHELLSEFEMMNCKGSNLPYQYGVKLTKVDDADEDTSAPFMELVGSLRWLSDWTLPNLSWTTGNLGKYMSCYKKRHFTFGKKALRYLKSHSDLCLRFEVPDLRGKNLLDEIKIEQFADSDFAGCPDTGRSTGGFTTFVNGCLINWSSKILKSVADSSCVAELMESSEGCKDIAYTVQFFEDLFDGSLEHRSIQYQDNRSTMKLVEKGFSKRAKHIKVKYFLVREYVNKGILEQVWCPSEDNNADLMTKGVDRKRFDKFTEEIGIKPKLLR